MSFIKIFIKDLENIKLSDKGRFYFNHVSEDFFVNCIRNKQMKSLIPASYKKYKIISIDNNKSIILFNHSKNYGIIKDGKFYEHESELIPFECCVHHSKDENDKHYFVFSQIENYVHNNTLLYFENDQFELYVKLNGRFYEPDKRLINFFVRNEVFYFIYRYGIEIFKDKKLIKEIIIEDNICNAVCTKDDMIYFGLEYSDCIGKYQDGEYIKIKIFDGRYECIDMVIGLKDEIYFLASYIADFEDSSDEDSSDTEDSSDEDSSNEDSSDAEDSIYNADLPRYVFGVYDTSFRRLHNFYKHTNCLSLGTNGEIIIKKSDSYLIYKPEYIL